MADFDFEDGDLPRAEYHDPNTAASKPGRINLDGRKYVFFSKQFKRKHKKHFGQDLFPIFKEHLVRCDSNPAKVLQTEPTIIVAAATEDIDDVLFLEFDREVLELREVKVGDRLVSINSYYYKEYVVDPKLVEGEFSNGHYGATFPLIGHFLCEAISSANQARDRIPKHEWERMDELIERRVKTGRTETHPGNPFEYLLYIDSLDRSGRLHTWAAIALGTVFLITGVTQLLSKFL